MRRGPVRIALVVLFGAVLATAAGAAPEAPVVRDGVIELPSEYLARHGELALSGSWQFWWHRLTGAIDQGAQSGELELMVPGTWDGQATDASRIVAEHGYGTYRLLVRGLVPDSSYALSVGTTPTAFRAYVQEADASGVPRGTPELVCSAGIVGTSAASAVPQFLAQWGTFTVHSPQIYVYVEVSNFENRTGGLIETPHLGAAASVKRASGASIALDFFAMGVFLFMAFHYLLRYALRRTDRAPLYFGLFCIVLTLNFLLTGRYLQSWVFVRPTPGAFVLFSKAAYWTLALLLPVFVEFISLLFSGLFARSVKIAYWSLAALFAIVAGVTPLAVYSRAFGLYDLAIVATGVYVTVGIARAAFSRKPGALGSLIGFILFYLTVINDLLHSNQIIYTTYLLQYGFLAFMGSQSALLSTTFHRALRYIETMNESLYRFVPREFISHLGKSSILEVGLGDAVTRRMTVMFSDIRSFTTMAERMSPDESFRFLNSYLERVGPVIRSHNGYIDKYIGDGIMALFPRSPDDAVASGVELLRTVVTYNVHRARSGYDPIRIGVGIHSGELVLGTIGENERIDGTVIADAVNLSSRLEGLNKTFGSSMIVTDTIYDAMPELYRAMCRRLGRTEVKGRREPVNIYEVVVEGVTSDYDAKMRTRLEFERAVDAYVKGRFEEAAGAFAALAAGSPNDAAVRYYVDRTADDVRGRSAE